MSKIVGWKSTHQPPEVRLCEFPNLMPETPDNKTKPRITPDMLDVEVDLTVQIGNSRKPVREFLKMQPGMILSLDQAEGAPATILVNGVKVGEGMVLVANDRYAIQVTKVGVQSA